MTILNGKWNLYPVENNKIVNCPEQLTYFKPIEATVPGNVELDLINAGILSEDIFKGMNITLAEKYETYAWWYEKDFVTPKFSNRLLLHFEGVDCFAEYWLNGKKIGTSQNSLIEYEFDVTDYVNPIGESNKLLIYIKSTMKEINKHEHNLQELAGWSRPEFTSVRKQAHSFGK